MSTDRIDKTTKSIGKPINPTPCMLLRRSVKYVIGEKNAKTYNGTGITFSGINIPLINNNGNFTNVLIVIMFEVISVGTAEIKTPRFDPIQESRKLPRRNPSSIVNGIPSKMSMKIPIKVDMKKLNNVEAKLMLTIKSNKLTGEEKISSRFFSLVSHGKITGLIAVLMKKTLMAKSPVNN